MIKSIRPRSRVGTREHKPGCPRFQFWDAGEYQCPCTCGGPYIVDKDGSLRTDYTIHKS